VRPRFLSPITLPFFIAPQEFIFIQTVFKASRKRDNRAGCKANTAHTRVITSFEKIELFLTAKSVNKRDPRAIYCQEYQTERGGGAFGKDL